MVPNRSPFRDSGLALAALTAFLYCASTAYTGGYFGILLLDSDVLDRNFHQVLYHGFFISVRPIILAFSVYAIVRGFYSHAVLPMTNDELRKSWKRKRKFLTLKYRLLGKRKDSPIEVYEKRRSISLVFLTGLLIVFVSFLAYFEQEGKESAILILTELNTKPIQDDKLISVTVNGEVKKLFYLGCGARNCAGVDPASRHVQYFPQNGHSFYLPPAGPKRPTE